jgi:hypothetical protein
LGQADVGDEQIELVARALMQPFVQGAGYGDRVAAAGQQAREGFGGIGVILNEQNVPG